jgi:predicted Zn-dependent protease
LSQLGQHAAAVAEYERVVARFPSQRVFRMNLGQALLQAGRRVEAVVQFQEVLTQYPQFRPALDALAAASRRR